jgi:hypothetical protein
MPQPARSADKEASEEVERLQARVEELETALGRRQRGSEAPSEERRAARTALEEELTEIEKDERSLRHTRADLLEELADELDNPVPDSDRVAELRARVRRIERQQRELRARRTEAARDLDAELRRIARRATRPARAARRGRYSRYDAPYEAGDPYPPLALADPAQYGGAPISAAVNEGMRLQNALLLGHLGMFGATANAVSAAAEDVLERTRARTYENSSQVAMALPADLAASVYTGLDHLVAAPRRTVDAFYGGYDTSRQ